MAAKLSELIKCYENSSEGDLSVWADKLELVARLQKISDLTTFLPLFLAGDAFAVYKKLTDEVKGDYGKLKKALLAAFSVSNYSAYEQLRMRTLQEGKTVDVFLADLRRIVALIGQADAEPLLKCAFMAGLPNEVATQLKSLAAAEDLGLTDLVTRARLMVSTTASGQISMCAAAQRSAEQRNSRSNGKGQSNKREIRCYNCNELGHIRRQCPQFRQRNENG